MKKYFLFLAAAGMMVSCNKLAENEFEISGKIDKSLDGKKVVLEKLGGYMGFIPVDTVQIKDGKFIIKDTVSSPSLHFISIDGMQGMSKLNIVLEPGEIELDINKDSIQNSKFGGSYNNDKLYEYVTEMKKLQKGEQKRYDAFTKKYASEIAQVRSNPSDTVTMNKLNKLFLEENKKSPVKEFSLKFIKDNPKAFINIYVLRDLLGKQSVTAKEAQDMFNKFDGEVKMTKEGKELGENIKTANAPAPAVQQSPEGNAAAQPGKQAAGFSAPNPEGKTVSLKENLGKVTIIDFWASWCPPCRKENPNVVAMYNKLHSKGLNIIGVSLDDDKERWKKAIAADKITWPQVSNLKKWEDPVAKLYGVESIPATFILDEKGNIVAQNLSGAALEAKVMELLKL